uniref:Uncharacterized protein n=1 Tax=Ananas comosus var. bracteatus TaxID=296719 RepID=A0A6V7NYA6_ANACO|nr:unnamed protein product [Ananas comosus var. bracteatus]
MFPYLSLLLVTHWTFANCKVRVFAPCSELFEIFWRVVDSVPTYGSYPENYGILSSAKATKEEDLGCFRVAVCKAVYRYTLMVVPTANRQCLRGVFAIVLFYNYTLRLRALPEPCTSRERGEDLELGWTIVGGEIFNPNSFQALFGASCEGARRVVDNFVRRNEGFRLFRHEDLVLMTDFYAYLPLCSFAHACEGRSLQAGTPKIAIVTCLCGIGRRSGLPWGRLIPSVGMLTTTGPLGTGQARQPTEPSAPAQARDHGKGVA